MDDHPPKLYTELAEWWPLLSAPADYAEEAEIYRRALVEACDRPPRSLIELGCGGGNNASHLEAHFDEMVLVDRSPGMLEVSRRLNPECVHRLGDMRTVRLERTFDTVFVHDAVSYLTTEQDLALAFATAFAHCAPGGAALFAPDHTRESFRETTSHGGHDGAERALRYLEWTWDPDPSESTYVADFAYLLREASGEVWSVQDRHVLGLFAQTTWLRLLEGAGFAAECLPFDHSEEPPGLVFFVGKRPAR